MLRKRYRVIYPVVLALLLTSCRSAMTPVPQTSGSAPPSAAASEPAPTSISLKYDLVDETYVNKNISIRYPQMTALGNSSKQDHINQLLKNDALKILSNYRQWTAFTNKPYEDVVSTSIDYAVKWQGANLLSIAYSGHSVLDGTRTERDFHTINLDLNAESELALKDFVNIDRRFADYFVNKAFLSKSSLSSEPEDNMMITQEFYDSLDFLYGISSAPKYDELIAYLSETDSKNTDSIVTSCDFSYITDDSLGIAVMVSRAAGNYSEFEISLKDIKDSLKMENEIWKDFPALLGDEE